ncbi:porin family protein [Tenacibaculum sp. SG-28]|uniref:porin family protein n=1 Tax=Tenacibaculum sp. SG-28 TaxID=754426 RepID=UPI000CF3BFDC|nr:porin family protein [Tenacibaculum sp. SG-28]PQJ21734.1 hypothetical protein BSU00_06550 [Tenacibaculum sp. SG-28]
MTRALLSVFAICVFSFSYAQGNINFGAKAGLNLATLTGDAEADMKAGFHIGGMAEISINEKFSVQPELLFSAQGAQEDITFDNGAGDQTENLKYNFSYINLPVMAKYYVTEALSLEAGPQIGFLVDSKVKAAGETVDAEDLLGDLSTIDFGLNFGFGYKLDSGLNFSARYNLGLSNISDDSNSDAEVKNSVFQFSIGYFFN